MQNCIYALAIPIQYSLFLFHCISMCHCLNICFRWLVKVLDAKQQLTRDAVLIPEVPLRKHFLLRNSECFFS